MLYFRLSLFSAKHAAEKTLLFLKIWNPSEKTRILLIEGNTIPFSLKAMPDNSQTAESQSQRESCLKIGLPFYNIQTADADTLFLV